MPELDVLQLASVILAAMSVLVSGITAILSILESRKVKQMELLFTARQAAYSDFLKAAEKYPFRTEAETDALYFAEMQIIVCASKETAKAVMGYRELLLEDVTTPVPDRQILLLREARARALSAMRRDIQKF